MDKIHFTFDLPISILKEGDRFIAYSPALDLSTSGKTYAEARKKFNEIIRIFFDETAKKGTLETVLRDLGWQKIRTQWTPPVLISHESQKVTV